jgi:hypothetical protein
VFVVLLTGTTTDVYADEERSLVCWSVLLAHRARSVNEIALFRTRACAGLNWKDLAVKRIPSPLKVAVGDNFERLGITVEEVCAVVCV